MVNPPQRRLDLPKRKLGERKKRITYDAGVLGKKKS